MSWLVGFKLLCFGCIFLGKSVYEWSDSMFSRTTLCTKASAYITTETVCHHPIHPHAFCWTLLFSRNLPVALAPLTSFLLMQYRTHSRVSAQLVTSCKQYFPTASAYQVMPGQSDQHLTLTFLTFGAPRLQNRYDYTTEKDNTRLTISLYSTLNIL